MSALSQALDRSGFPAIADPEAEARKLAVLRIVVGLLLAWRSGMIARDAAYYFDPGLVFGRRLPLEAIAGWMQCVLAEFSGRPLPPPRPVLDPGPDRAGDVHQ
jgi:hypothetical protein